MLGLPRSLLNAFAFDDVLVADNPLVRQRRPHVVDRAATGKDFVERPFVVPHIFSRDARAYAHHIGGILQGKHPVLLIGLIEEAGGDMQAAIPTFHAVFDPLFVFTVEKVERDGNQIAVLNALAVARR